MTDLRDAVVALPTEWIDGDGRCGGITDFDLHPPQIRVVSLDAVLALIDSSKPTYCSDRCECFCHESPEEAAMRTKLSSSLFGHPGAHIPRDMVRDAIVEERALTALGMQP
jgi:hypothetical protein